jgi:hypothetical protein
VLAVLAVLATAIVAGSAGAAPPNDPYFGLQWGIQQTNADEAWATSTGAPSPHGTHVAGIAAAVEERTLGWASVRDFP